MTDFPTCADVTEAPWRLLKVILSDRLNSVFSTENTETLKHTQNAIKTFMMIYDAVINRTDIFLLNYLP